MQGPDDPANGGAIRFKIEPSLHRNMIDDVRHPGGRLRDALLRSPRYRTPLRRDGPVINHHADSRGMEFGVTQARPLDPLRYI